MNKSSCKPHVVYWIISRTKTHLPIPSLTHWFHLIKAEQAYCCAGSAAYKMQGWQPRWLSRQRFFFLEWCRLFDYCHSFQWALSVVITPIIMCKKGLTSPCSRPEAVFSSLILNDVDFTMTMLSPFWLNGDRADRSWAPAPDIQISPCQTSAPISFTITALALSHFILNITVFRLILTKQMLNVVPCLWLY